MPTLPKDHTKCLAPFEITVVCLGMAAAASAANRTWIGGNNDWDGTTAIFRATTSRTRRRGDLQHVEFRRPGHVGQTK